MCLAEHTIMSIREPNNVFNATHNHVFAQPFRRHGMFTLLI